MKPFDIEAARTGARVCTNDGNTVRILCFDEQLGFPPYPYSVLAIINVQGAIVPAVFDIHGRADNAPLESDCFLMMADDDYLEKLERGEYDKPTR